MLNIPSAMKSQSGRWDFMVIILFRSISSSEQKEKKTTESTTLLLRKSFFLFAFCLFSRMIFVFFSINRLRLNELKSQQVQFLFATAKRTVFSSISFAVLTVFQATNVGIPTKCQTLSFLSHFSSWMKINFYFALKYFLFCSPRKIYKTTLSEST